MNIRDAEDRDLEGITTIYNDAVERRCQINRLTQTEICLTSGPLGQSCRIERGGFLVHRNLHGVKMRQKSVGSKDAADKLVKNIRRKTARRYLSEEKIRIILAEALLE